MICETLSCGEGDGVQGVSRDCEIWSSCGYLMIFCEQFSMFLLLIFLLKCLLLR